MDAPVIFGLVGPSGSGKTTVCTYLRCFAFTRIHVATPLKHGFCEMFGVPESYTEQPLIEQSSELFGGASPRAILEHLGTELHQVAPRALPAKLDRLLAQMIKRPSPRILVDGLRRATEGEVIHKHGGQVIRLLGKDVDPDKPCDLSQLDVSHDIELRWSPTVAGLHAQIDAVLVRLGIALADCRDI